MSDEDIYVRRARAIGEELSFSSTLLALAMSGIFTFFGFLFGYLYFKVPTGDPAEAILVSFGITGIMCLFIFIGAIRDLIKLWRGG